MDIRKQFDEWFKSDRKESLKLTDGITYIIIKHKIFGIERLEVKIFFDDDQIFYYTVILNAAIDADYFFEEVAKAINDYIDAQADIARRVKKFICLGDENEIS